MCPKNLTIRLGRQGTQYETLVNHARLLRCKVAQDFKGGENESGVWEKEGTEMGLDHRAALQQGCRERGSPK